VTAWEARGEYRELAGHRIFTVSGPALGPERAEPLLVLHGFPTSSFDFHSVLDDLRRDRRVMLLDFLGYGYSEKPDLRYSISLQADVVVAFTTELGIGEVTLLTHDMGDTVGGELLARQMEGAWPVHVTRRVLANGSIYIDMAHLSAGQQFLLALPDARLAPTDALGADAIKAGLTATFSADSTVDADELDAHWQLIVHADGERMLPRLIRYIEDRRRDEARYTGAIVDHPSPLGIVWGVDDPIAVVAMATRLQAERPDASLTLLDGVGHYPMIESPSRFAAAVARTLRP
jgi:pimeloyl-ACP methyl ester carboxylesterase